MSDRALSRSRILLVAGALLVCLPGPPRAAEAEASAIAVIAHPRLPVHDLSLAELRRIFGGDRQFWSEDLPVTVLVPAPGSPERTVLLSRVYGKTEIQYRHYWIAKVFRTEVASAPKVVASPRMAADLVLQIEGAISVAPAARVPPGVKVLKVNGKTWEDGDYPLR